HVFFFQAEDGIRDFHVTGVQTCALPISALAAAPPAGTPAPGRQGDRRADLRTRGARGLRPRAGAAAPQDDVRGRRRARQARAQRSEERCVGRERYATGTRDDARIRWWST